MDFISVFDMLKVGVGPSSSHTLGPWRAAQRFIGELKENKLFDRVTHLHIDLYGSLSLTGKGHATDFAVLLGLSGYDPVTIATEKIDSIISEIQQTKTLLLASKKRLAFDFDKDICFNNNFLDFHANALSFTAKSAGNEPYKSTFYSTGGGFIIKEFECSNIESEDRKTVPFPISLASDLLKYCKGEDKSISDIVLQNELSTAFIGTINEKLEEIWNVMLQSMYIGCHSQGVLPGGLSVKRRAFDIHAKLIGEYHYDDYQSWIESIRKTQTKFRDILKWVSCFALAVNEVNASLGRVVTAPTNGSAGVIPSVLMYYIAIENHKADISDIQRFLLVAGEVGSIFKKGATISAAMGGCQAEIGVSSAMAAAGLCELLGGSPEQVLVAAEIAMEHHLGLTCDPIGGLVQIPCIERNSMGAIKAINATELALETNPKDTKISLDKVISTMWETAKNMSSDYKETSRGGLAITVNLPNC